MPKTDVLPLLADGEFHSGQELADVLGVSRTAVWKQLKKLEELGLEVEASKASGYRLPGGIQLLDRDLIQDALSPFSRKILSELWLEPIVDSTNAQAMRLLDQGRGSGLVCIAEQQSAGRGRRGRSWVSPYASNLYLSVTQEFSGGAAALEGLSLAVGVAVAEGLDDCGASDIQLKWPNDLLHDKRKLGGILIEMVGDVAGSCTVVTGVGINVAMPAAAAEGIDQAWTDLRQVGVELPDRNQVLARVLDRLLPMLGSYEESGFEPYREAWLTRDSHANQAVIVHSGNQEWAGTARGVNGQGALLLETESGIQPVFGGEVSLRAAS